MTHGAEADRRTALDPASPLSNMAGVTGTACAAFALLALDDTNGRAGAFAPEDWADPAEFYRALERVGVPHHQIVKAI